MILTLVAIWIALSVIFFGSLAIAASRPLPVMDPDEISQDPTLSGFTARTADPVLAGLGSDGSDHELETVPSGV